MTEDDLLKKIKSLQDSVWEGRAKQPDIERWLNNFTASPPVGTKERLHALYLLSNFIYFGSDQMRELVRALYRDLYRYPIIQAIRQRNSNTLDTSLIHSHFDDELRHTRFLGVGNPSESGCHLLYYFRQENALPKTPFIHSHEIFDRRGSGTPPSLSNPDIRRYVFIDDFCGSGKQGLLYSQQIVEDIKALNKHAIVAYYVLFAVRDGLERVKKHTSFDYVDCIFELDPSFKCFGPESRYSAPDVPEIDWSFAETMCRQYGSTLWPRHPLGYDDCQLLIGFHHNIPDNTLPIIWSDGTSTASWTPIFRRYPKVYGW